MQFSCGGGSHSSARTVSGASAPSSAPVCSRFHAVKPGASWLCPTPNHRERFLDMQERLRTARMVTLATLSATAVVVGATGGWPMLVAAARRGDRGRDRRRAARAPAPPGAVGLRLDDPRAAARARSRRRAERRPRSLAPNLLAIPVLMVAARFSNRGLVVGAPISALLVLAITLGIDPAYVVAHPESLMVPLALVCAPRSTSARSSPPTCAIAPTARSTSSPGCSTAAPSSRASPRSPSRRRSPSSRSASCWPTSTTSSRSTTSTATASATPCCATSPTRCAARLRTFELLYRLGGEEFALLLPARRRTTRRGSPRACASRSRSWRPPGCR